ncbi:MAG TPA: FAD:protein FMN transferase [Streptosporangiaceae bacterium]|nr:FAD:protein FMN transferase [Streptosporangiaceae bacterium]
MSRRTEAAVTFGVFGTTGTLTVTEPAAVTQAFSLVEAELARIDLACSRFRDDSEISRVNASAGAVTRISELFAEALGVALTAATLTDGDVDPTCGRALIQLGYDRDFTEIGPVSIRLPARPEPVPGWHLVGFDRGRRLVRLPAGILLDLGATAKAWASDRCAAIAAGELGCGVLVSLGGDIAAAGPAPRAGWQIRVTDDRAAPADAPGQTVTIYSGGLATSNTTVRSWSLNDRPVHHIVNPATGEPARSRWRTVTVAAATCLDANTASTAAIIRDYRAPRWLAGLRLPARLVHVDGSVVRVAGWPPEPGSAGLSRALLYHYVDIRVD